MEANLPAQSGYETPPPKARLPYATWGAQMAIIGVLLALAAGFLLGIPVLVIDRPAHGHLSDAANAALQFATALGFLLVPLAIASRMGEVSLATALRRLGARRFRPLPALGWMAVAVIAYVVFVALYVAIVGEPKQEDIAKTFGALPVQILLIVIMAPVSEEICFRGMLYGGLRSRLPRSAAALLSGLIFGGLHALTGISTVPPLVAFGVILALLYERTGSIVPGILLHMLNNCFALLGK